MGNKKKKFTIVNYITSMTVVAFIIFEVVLYFGNIFTIIDGIPYFIYRYIPAFITGFLVTFFTVKICSKKLYKKDASTVKKVAFIAPVVVAVVMFIFEFVSVQDSFREAQSKLDNFSGYFGNGGEYEELYKLMYGKSFDEYVADMKREAIVMRVILMISYIAGGELGAFLAVKKVDSLLQDDVPLDYLQNVINPPTNGYSDNGVESPNSTPQNINWNL